jgi:hypothetical protein
VTYKKNYKKFKHKRLHSFEKKVSKARTANLERRELRILSEARTANLERSDLRVFVGLLLGAKRRSVEKSLFEKSQSN